MVRIQGKTSDLVLTSAGNLNPYGFCLVRIWTGRGPTEEGQGAVWGRAESMPARQGRQIRRQRAATRRGRGVSYDY
jgi:hypothetical protein